MQAIKGLSRLRSRASGWRLSAFVLAYLLLFGTSARADTDFNTTAAFTFSGSNTCLVPAEGFVGTGGLHIIVSSNLSMGGMVQSHLKANFQGMKATVPISGKKYQVPESETNSYEFDTPDLAPFHTTFEFMVQFIRFGDDGTYIFGDDFFEHFLAHATVNANGVVTVDDLTDDTRCH